jgi:hypothetical protein
MSTLLAVNATYVVEVGITGQKKQNSPLWLPRRRSWDLLWLIDRSFDFGEKLKTTCHLENLGGQWCWPSEPFQRRSGPLEDSE